MANWNQASYLKAWNFATIKHHGQCYGGPNPNVRIDYINHIGSVAMELMWLFQSDSSYNEDLAIQVALLHDVVEDTDTEYDEVKAHFGEQVADGVMALSKNPNIVDKIQKMEDSLSRIKAQPKEIWLVKLADRISNLYHPPHYWQQPKIESYKEESEQVYRALHTANKQLSDRLRSLIDGYGALRSDLFPDI